VTHTATTPAASKKVDGYSVGQTLTVTCEAPAHGGAFVARTEQGVIFVRHGIVGEQAEVRITAIGPKRRFYFADVISVPVPSLARRAHPWIQADALATEEERAAATGVPELLGGMEYGHINLDEQRRYKTDIVRTQINRLGGLPLESPLLTNLMVEELPLRDNNEGLSWRSRVRYNVTKVRAHNSEEQNGGKKSPAVTWRVGMHPYRASQPVPVVDFPLAATELRNLQLEQLNLRGVREVEATVSSRGRVLLQFIVDPRFSVEEVAKDIEQQASDAWGLLAKRKISLFPRKTVRVQVGKALDIASLVEDASPEAKHTRTELGVVTDAMLDAITAELEKIRGEKAPEGRWNPRTKRREAPGTPSGPVGGALGEPDEK